MSIELIEQTFEMEGPAQIKVSNVRGHIEILPGDEGVIHVKAEKHKATGFADNTEIILKQEDNGSVVVEAKHEKSFTNWFGLNKPCKVDFKIRVPKTCSVDMNCVSSSAVIKDLEGDFNIQGVSGDIQLNNLNGQFDINSVSGKLTAHNLEGPLEINNVSGKVKIHESQIPSLIGKTVSGNTTIETPLIDGPYHFKSVSGNMNVVTPEDTACTVFMKSMSGRAKIKLPITNRSGRPNKQVIEVAGGGPEVIMKSISGVLSLGSPNFVKTETDENEQDILAVQEVDQPTQIEARPESHQKTQMEILQEIENGEITVNEALKILNF
jgi:hypothetical protein